MHIMLSLRLHGTLFLVNLLICVNSLSLESPSIITNTFGNETDRLALLSFKTYLIDAPNGALHSWNDSLHFCEWRGVTCGRRHQRVTLLRLDGQSLAGFLPPSIGNLTFLRGVNFSSNKLQGTIPKDIGRLSRLQYLDLRNNSLTGEIPDDLTNCSNLKLIDLGINKLIGKVPGYSLLKLQKLYLDDNDLTGGIPSSLGNLSSLLYLSLRRNSLEGSIPHDLSRLKSLRGFLLNENNLSGMLHSSLCNLSSVLVFAVTDNNLSGNLMPNMGLCFPNLLQLAIGVNQFTGPIPATLPNISGLQIFDASQNNLSGQVPNNLGVLKDLRRFNIENNSLGSGKSGDLDFLISLTNVSNLIQLGIPYNQFGGVLPNSVANLSTQLIALVLGGNKISGSIPEGIGNLINLNVFAIEYNYFTGVIPSSIGKLHQVGILSFGGNRLSGFIPSTLGNLTRLFTLSLDGNNLEGNIPLPLKNCRSMQRLFLAQCGLTGSIPENFIGQFDQLIILHLYQNSLTGSLPRDVGNLKNLQELYIYDNKLSGEIPRDLGNSLALEYLSMAGNLLEGSIPSSLEFLRGIQTLDLSRNNLSGRIPNELQDLSYLRSLNLSFNHLEGEVPTEGVFRNASRISITANKKLCGGIPQLQLPTCPNLESGMPPSTKVIIAVTISTGVFLAFIVGFVILYGRKKQKRKSSSTTSFGDGYPRVSYKELFEATGGFASSSLIGMGSFGSVYKGILGEDERLVAVKVLNLQKRGASKSFVAECMALRSIRHRNLLKIISSCSSVDFRGNNFLALVFEFMPNGSLEDWLHQSKNLNLSQRLDIAIDIAHALDYLHHQCETPIVHCDLKPSNVLLDIDMVAHVGDFGLARLLYVDTGNFSKDQINSFAITGSIGYVSPEYGMGAKVSAQGDVYSYGILLLEMVTGRRPTDDMFKDGMSLHNFAEISLAKQGREIADSYLLEEFEEAANNVGDDEDVEGKMWECLVSIARIGVACSVELPGERMDIKDVVKELHLIKKRFPWTGIPNDKKLAKSTACEGTSCSP